MRRSVALALALAAAGNVEAQQLVVSPAADAVSVSIYGDTNREDGKIDLDWLGGYALITETRTVQLPAGGSEIRFEGVAGNILPASVIIRGLPEMPREKNYDARLLSAGSLIGATLGRQVHIRRTDRATGKVTEGEAIIRSGPDGILLQTAAGFEALQCTDLAETLTYSEVPPGLSAKPTLAIRASAASPTTAKLQLSYLATQFDWQANYVARLRKDGRTMDLFAWLTLANGNAESFPAADVNAIAGYPNREEDDDHSGTYASEVNLRCWPAGRTSDPTGPAFLPPPPPPEPERDYEGDDIVVTGSRIPQRNFEVAMPVTAITAQQEDLGDLKLYRIPEPVTVAAIGQKQVALLHKENVRVERLYSIETGAIERERVSGTASIMLRARNSKERGLGLPLPAGSVSVFEEVNGESLLAGETSVYDYAIDEDVELVLGDSPDIRFTQRTLARSPKDQELHQLHRVRAEIELSNATPHRARVEVGLSLFGTWDIERSSDKLKIVKGTKTWVADVPANGRARLTYTVARPKPRKSEDESDED